MILETIKKCDANGVKVFGLGALNKVSGPSSLLEVCALFPTVDTCFLILLAKILDCFVSMHCNL
jgi:hypothetical protein